MLRQFFSARRNSLTGSIRFALVGATSGDSDRSRRLRNLMHRPRDESSSSNSSRDAAFAAALAKWNSVVPSDHYLREHQALVDGAERSIVFCGKKHVCAIGNMLSGDAECFAWIVSFESPQSAAPTGSRARPQTNLRKSDRCSGVQRRSAAQKWRTWRWLGLTPTPYLVCARRTSTSTSAVPHVSTSS